jgi:hypothetical protein
MSKELLTKSLAKAADAAGYAMTASEEDLAELNRIPQWPRRSRQRRAPHVAPVCPLRALGGAHAVAV